MILSSTSKQDKVTENLTSAINDTVKKLLSDILQQLGLSLTIIIEPMLIKCICDKISKIIDEINEVKKKNSEFKKKTCWSQIKRST